MTWYHLDDAIPGVYCGKNEESYKIGNYASYNKYYRCSEYVDYEL